MILGLDETEEDSRQAVGKGARLKEVKPIIINWLRGNPRRKGFEL